MHTRALMHTHALIERMFLKYASPAVSHTSHIRLTYVTHTSHIRLTYVSHTSHIRLTYVSHTWLFFMLAQRSLKELARMRLPALSSLRFGVWRGHGTGRVFRQKFTLEDAIGSHACSLDANMRVTNDIPLGSSLLLPVCTVNCVQTLKVYMLVQEWEPKMDLRWSC
jgi:hypothetical protein